MNNSQNKTMDEIIAELQENIMDAAKGSCRLKIQYEKEFAQDGGEDVSDKLPSLTEALKLRETMNKIKEIYNWGEITDYEDFIDAVSYREKIYEKYYGDNEDIKEKYEKLEEENEKLKKDLDTNIEVRCNLETDVLKLASQIKELQDADAMWRSMAKQQFGGDDDDGVWCAGEVSVEIDNLKGQIPAKKGKKLSKDDKETLEEILHNIEYPFGTEGHHNDGGGWFYEAKVKLLKRLLK